MKIGILDYGVGNVGSLANMIKYINHKPILSNSIKDLSDNKVIFIPGVGSFDKAMQAIDQKNNISATQVIRVSPTNNNNAHMRETPILFGFDNLVYT